MKYCPNCGTACEEGALFCGECGYKLEAPTAAPVSQPEEDYVTADSSQQGTWQNRYQKAEYYRGAGEQPQYNSYDQQPQYNSYDQQPQYSSYDQPSQYKPSDRVVQKKNKSNKVTIIILSALITVMLALIGLTIVLILKQKNTSDHEAAVSESLTESEESNTSEITEASSEEEPEAESETAASSDVVVESETASSSEEIVEEPAEPSEMTLLSREPDLTNYAMAIVSGASASSTIVQTDTVTSNKPILLFDNDENTNWQEGVDGYGIGEYVVCTLERNYRIKYLGFKLGNWKADPRHDYYRENAKPKTLEFDFGTYVDTVTFLPDRVMQWVELDVPVETDFLQITIRDIYPGTDWEDTVISDILIYTEK